MDCRNARRQFDSFLLGELGNERKAELESHLQKCTSCQGQWQEFRQFIWLVQGSLRMIPPPKAMARVSLVAVSRPRNRVVRVLAMATAGVLLLVFTALPLRLTPMPGPLQASSGIPSRSVVTLTNGPSVSPVQTQGSWYIAFR
ncbi:MAG: zf-HC2 domain-containing protein [Coprothermobacterota bacterium]|nr:zf-HC2 domain-containing protein [Coprothermobacterota bacterium]